MPKTRKARPPLSPERIVAAALALVAEHGLAGLSFRRLGVRLGCEAMSIYHHYPSKQHLLDALVDQAIASVELPGAELAPVDRLRASMYGYRAMAHRAPALFPLLAVHRLNTPTGVRFIENILELIHAIVPDVELAARHFRAIGYYLVGAALDETAGYAKGPSAAEPASDEFIVRECPRLVAAARFFKANEWDNTFALGLEALIARMAADGTALHAT